MAKYRANFLIVIKMIVRNGEIRKNLKARITISPMMVTNESVAAKEQNRSNFGNHSVDFLLFYLSILFNPFHFSRITKIINQNPT